MSDNENEKDCKTTLDCEQTKTTKKEIGFGKIKTSQCVLQVLKVKK